jgi:hypothetical protein
VGRERVERERVVRVEREKVERGKRERVELVGRMEGCYTAGRWVKCFSNP